MALAAAASVSPASAQEVPAVSAASPFLPAGHWSVDAMRRLGALGLAPDGGAWGERTPTRLEVGRALRAAAMGDAEGAGALLAQRYWERYREEFPATAALLAAGAEAPAFGAEGAVTVAAAARRGAMLAGNGRAGKGIVAPQRLEGRLAPVGAASLGVQAGTHLAGAATLARTLEGWDLVDAYGTGAWRGVGVWAGRRVPTIGPGIGGGVVLSGAVPVTGVGFSLAEPATLPWLLRHAGPVRFESWVGALRENAGLSRPWLLGNRVSFAPHPRLAVGLSRAAMLWESNLAGLASVLAMQNESENQVASVDVRYRPPAGALPLALWAEWGWDDGAGAVRDDPGVLLGAELAAVPGIPGLALAMEHTAFVHDPPWASGKRRARPWYRHFMLTDGWTDEHRLLGHPLGGDGAEWLARARLDALDARLRLDGRAFVRRRDATNLFAPDREGRSRGAALSAVYVTGLGLELVADAAVELGAAGWREGAGWGGVRWRW